MRKQIDNPDVALVIEYKNFKDSPGDFHFKVDYKGLDELLQAVLLAMSESTDIARVVLAAAKMWPDPETQKNIARAKG